MGGASFEDDIAREVVEKCGGSTSFTAETPSSRCQTSFADCTASCRSRACRERCIEQKVSVRYAGRAPNLEQLDLTPVPDFDEFFMRRAATKYEEQPDAHGVMLPSRQRAAVGTA